MALCVTTHHPRIWVCLHSLCFWCIWRPTTAENHNTNFSVTQTNSDILIIIKKKKHDKLCLICKGPPHFPLCPVDLVWIKCQGLSSFTGILPRSAWTACWESCFSSSSPHVDSFWRRRPKQGAESQWPASPRRLFRLRWRQQGRSSLIQKKTCLLCKCITIKKWNLPETPTMLFLDFSQNSPSHSEGHLWRRTSPYVNI